MKTLPLVFPGCVKLSVKTGMEWASVRTYITRGRLGCGHSALDIGTLESVDLGHKEWNVNTSVHCEELVTTQAMGDGWRECGQFCGLNGVLVFNLCSNAIMEWPCFCLSPSWSQSGPCLKLVLILCLFNRRTSWPIHESQAASS